MRVLNIVAMATLVIASNFIGDSLHEIFDPRLR